MLSDYAQMGTDKIKIEANWNAAVTPGKAFKITVGKEEAILERDDLYALMMLFGDEEQQSDLIPVKQQEVRSIRRLITVRAQKDIKKGETIRFAYEYFVPGRVYESLLLHRPKEYSSSNLSTNKLESDIQKLV
ncbi:MAG: hypothetical protein DDT19_02903 [Syntrophomonadaceae bacterium]|nr:hypothetical protein [Bacillota bacterium]